MNEGDLLRCLLQVIGRSAIPDKTVRAINGKGKNRIKAYNLFDGRLTITEVSKKAKIDQGNLSRAINVWVDSGIAFRIGEGDDARLLHVYPIPKKPPKEQE
jgi:hypothetical protein